MTASHEQLGDSHTQAGIHCPPNAPPSQAATYHRAEFPLPHGRSLLVIRFKYSGVYLCIPNSLTIPSSPATISSFPECGHTIILNVTRSLVSHILSSESCLLRQEYVFCQPWINAGGDPGSFLLPSAFLPPQALRMTLFPCSQMWLTC